jgi:hypothetical protein
LEPVGRSKRPLTHCKLANLEYPTIRPFQVLLCLLFVFAGATFLGQAVQAKSPTEPLSVSQCIQLAKNAPSSVKQAHAQLDAAKFVVRGAKVNFLPQLSISNGFTYNSPLLYDRNAFSFVALNGVREYSSLATSSLEVDTSGRLRAIYDRASANRHSAEVNVVISVSRSSHVKLIQRVATAKDAKTGLLLPGGRRYLLAVPSSKEEGKARIDFFDAH